MTDESLVKVKSLARNYETIVLEYSQLNKCGFKAKKELQMIIF
jgi:hypothetical protein